MSEALLEVEGVRREFEVRSGSWGRARGRVRAVDGVSLAVRPGETLGLVGETGCGKSTLALMMVRLLQPTSGTIRYRGRDVASLRGRDLAAFRREVQLVFQDPFSSLDPRMRIGEIVAEPLRVHRRRSDARRVAELLEMVGLSPEAAGRFPHQFSGGQRQRIGIARAIALEPRLIVCDEPVSALDVSIQAQILNLLKSLQRRLGLAYVFISHDLSVVRHVSDRIAVMYLGRIAETASTEDLFAHSRHPYTRALLSAVPIPDPRRERRRERIVLHGDPPSPAAPPAGCCFHPRCPRRTDACVERVPVLEPSGSGHLVACLHPVPDGEQLEMPAPPGPR